MATGVTSSVPNSASASPTRRTYTFPSPELDRDTVTAVVRASVDCPERLYNKIGSMAAMVKGALFVWEKFAAAGLPIDRPTEITDAVVAAFRAGYTVYFRRAACDTTDAAIAATGYPAYHPLLDAAEFGEFALKTLEFLVMPQANGTARVAADTEIVAGAAA
ncbi:uncharacterized protein LOC62_02G003370 [Vanrija pseudolonga]|uniref:Uncharacterized protein n=1 Tax=Vanrija pseudolonga TaxID=143232 RepID=A0AAF0Y4B7_9TREE|nr:hypothetical protein LOC62_02G003370 [Vanrija pseudolonga]